MTTQQVTVPQGEFLGVIRLLTVVYNKHMAEGPACNEARALLTTMDEAIKWLRAMAAIEQNASTVSAGSFS